MFKTEQERDLVEHKYGFSEVDLEEYAARIETKADRLVVKEVQVSADVEQDIK